MGRDEQDEVNVLVGKELVWSVRGWCPRNVNGKRDGRHEKGIFRRV